MDTVYEIKVSECPIVVKDTIEESWKTVPEFSITVKTSQYIHFVIRYIPDLYSFDHLVKTHYQKIKIPFPTLTESLSKAEKRRSIRNFFHMHMKSNAEKVEKYLYRCSMDPVLKSSTLLRDFFSAQREGDSKSFISLKDKQHWMEQQQQLQLLSHDDNNYCSSSSPSYDQLVPPTPTNDDNDDYDDDDPAAAIINEVDSRIDIGKVWVPSPHPSVKSLPLSSKHGSMTSRHNSIVSSISNNNYSVHSYDNDNNNMSAQHSLIDDEEDDDLIHIMSKKKNNNDSKKEQSPYFEYDFPLDHLEMVKVLGKGCMGKVLLVRSQTTKELYALKSIIKEHVIEQREITHTLDEKKILATLSEINHPYLAKLHTSFQDEHRLYLLTNYYNGGDLATHMAKLYSFPKECALFYAAEIIDGIGELHRLGVLYRDLKPENILLTGDGHIILTDFGLSKWLDASTNYTTATFCGTAEYLAPEVLLGESYSFGIDHWSFGTILYEMLAGITPFWADNHSDMYHRVLQDPLEFPADVFDYETAEFLSDILDRDPRTRLGVNGIEEIKDHVYFADIDWDDIRHRKVQPPFLPPVDGELDFTNFDPDFLTMTPQLTPVPSEINLSDQVQDIFDGYSFTDQHYMEYEEQQQSTSRIYSGQQFNYHQDGFYKNDADVEEEEDEQMPPLFQPARKRGSVSMLSNVDSFCLDDDLIKPSFSRDNIAEIAATATTSTSFKDEELARYAKRRNTSASEDRTEMHVEPQQQQQHTTTSTLVVIDNNHLQHHHHHIPSSNNSSIKFDDQVVEFSSKLPDLRLSFHMDREEQEEQPKRPKSKKSSMTPSNKSSHTSKTRRFFSLLL